MRYYYGSESDRSFAVYQKEGTWYPVFVEQYGNEPVHVQSELEEITDEISLFAIEKYMRLYEENKPKVYMAGPLFNEGDQYTNKRISDALRALGYSTFLPQEVVIDKNSPQLVRTACLYMDLKAIRACEYMIINCNGIEVDSGTAAEVGFGYAIGKKMIAYKSDVRNYFNEQARLNNFLGGLLNNDISSTLEEVIERLEKLAK